MNPDNPEQLLAERTYRVVAYQLATGCLLALGFFLWGTQGWWQAQSALFGVFVNVCMAFLLGWSVRRAGKAAAQSTQKSMLILLLGGVQRFVLVLVMFGVAFAVLKLDPLATIVGFALAQLSYLIRIRDS